MSTVKNMNYERVMDNCFAILNPRNDVQKSFDIDINIYTKTQ